MILNAAVTGVAIKILLVFCGYESYRSIDTKTSSDDHHWLTFWMFYSFLQFAEFWLDYILVYLPFYFEAKLALLVFLGPFKGAITAYDKGGKAAIKAAENGVKQVSDREDVKKYTNMVSEKTSGLMKRGQKAAAE